MRRIKRRATKTSQEVAIVLYEVPHSFFFFAGYRAINLPSPASRVAYSMLTIERRRVARYQDNNRATRRQGERVTTPPATIGRRSSGARRAAPNQRRAHAPSRRLPLSSRGAAKAPLPCHQFEFFLKRFALPVLLSVTFLIDVISIVSLLCSRYTY